MSKDEVQFFCDAVTRETEPGNIKTIHAPAVTVNLLRFDWAQHKSGLL